jgi:hypothetical protein
MSAGSRNTQGRGQAARGQSARAWFYGPQGFGSTRGSFPGAPAAESASQEAGKPVLVPVSGLVEGETVRSRIFHCDGPTGPCLLELGHPGDHLRPTAHVEAVPARDYAAENAELRSLLRVAATLLKDWPFARGASFRRDLVARIERVMER